jgi:mycofactocin system glycosyltransferase
VTLPERFGLVLDRSARTFRNGTVLVGGSPGRLITLTPQGVATLDALLAGEEANDGSRQLAQRLVDAGMAHPRRPEVVNGNTDITDLTVVVPVHNHAEALDRCLASLGTTTPVVVVDDASDDPDAVAAVCDRHRAQLIRRPINGGPAAARNQAVDVVTTDLVAFVDADCRVTDGWLEQLVWMFEDPDMGAVAPRVRPDRATPDADPGALTRFADAHSALDMGPEPSEVDPIRSVRYVPSAALVIRREAFDSAGGFDSRLRVGEDVDLVWRLAGAGWRVRYEPSSIVFHEEPRTWPGTLARRFRYGTSAGPLSKRHAGRLAPVDVRLLPAAAALAALSGRYRTAMGLVAASTASTGVRIRGRGITLGAIVRWNVASPYWAIVGMGRASTMLAGPVLVMALLRGGRARRAAAVLLLAPPLVDWWKHRPGLDPVRWTLASVVDDLCYGAGVWTGCFRSRSFGPVCPRVRVSGRS